MGIATASVYPDPEELRAAFAAATEDFDSGIDTQGLLPGEIPVGESMPGTGKVVPAQDDSFMDSDLDKDLEDLATPRSNEDSVEGVWGMMLRVPAIAVALKLIKTFSYDCLKEATRHMLDNAQIKIAISFEDMLMAMTMFVLFADSVKIMVVEKSEAAGKSVLDVLVKLFFVGYLPHNTIFPSFSLDVRYWRTNSKLNLHVFLRSRVDSQHVV